MAFSASTFCINPQTEESSPSNATGHKQEEEDARNTPLDSMSQGSFQECDPPTVFPSPPHPEELSFPPELNPDAKATPDRGGDFGASSSHGEEWGTPSEGGSTPEQYSDWPPVLPPTPNGGYPKLKMSSLVHYYILAPVCVLSTAAAILYLGWKTVYIYSNITTAGPTSVVFLTIEWISFLSVLALYMEISRPSKDRPALQIPPTGPFPFCNIFICCCKEPVDIIADTILAAMRQIYPEDQYCVWVLDDGADDELKAHVEAEAAELYGHERLRYLRRNKKPGVPHHFKAGNINHGLNHCGGEFVAILDADMIPSPYFLTSVLPHFTSEKIAFVQCPQSYYNLAHGDPLNDMAREFYDILLPFRDGRATAQCVGTGVIFRISALRQNGGITVGSITEDFDTALSLHSLGFNSAYVNQKLQAGLTAWTLEGYVKQRQRWAMGSLQMLLQRKPLMIKGSRFNVYRRIAYWWAGACYYMNGFTIVTILFPLIVLAFDLPIMPRNSPADVTRLYLILLGPYVLLSRLSAYLPYARFPRADLILLRAEQPWIWNSWFNVMSILKYFFPWFSNQFDSTGSKRIVERSLLQRLPIVWFHLTYAALGIGICLWQLIVLDYTQCGRVLKIGGWMPAVAYVIQTLMVPVMYVINEPRHPKPEKRKEYLLHSKEGIPYFNDRMLRAKTDWTIPLYYIIPVIWGIILGFFFFAAIFNYAPSFCADGGFFTYNRF